MKSIETWAKAYCGSTMICLAPFSRRAREMFRTQPSVASAILVVILGMTAILTGFPTKAGSTTLAGALFGAGAAFIGSWVTEKNHADAEKAAQKQRMQAARVYFTPELSRVIGQQIWVLGRLVPNFSAASRNQTMPQVEPWETFRPRRPVLYPMASQFKDLSEADATTLINFYDSVQGVAETIEAWIEIKTPQEVNAWNVLMQAVRDSLRLGAIAVRRFCPDRQLSPLLPASGTLLANIERTSTMVQSALDSHLARSPLGLQ